MVDVGTHRISLDDALVAKAVAAKFWAGGWMVLSIEHGSINAGGAVALGSLVVEPVTPVHVQVIWNLQHIARQRDGAEFTHVLPDEEIKIIPTGIKAHLGPGESVDLLGHVPGGKGTARSDSKSVEKVLDASVNGCAIFDLLSQIIQAPSRIWSRVHTAAMLMPMSTTAAPAQQLTKTRGLELDYITGH